MSDTPRAEPPDAGAFEPELADTPATAGRLSVRKTYKLYVGGAFARSESGRTYEVRAADRRFLANAALASRKDARDAVVAAAIDVIDALFAGGQVNHDGDYFTVEHAELYSRPATPQWRGRPAHGTPLSSQSSSPSHSARSRFSPDAVHGRRRSAPPLRGSWRTMPRRASADWTTPAWRLRVATRAIVESWKGWQRCLGDDDVIEKRDRTLFCIARY